MPARKKPDQGDGEVVIRGTDLPVFVTGSEPTIYASGIQVIQSTFDFCLLLNQFEMSEDGPRMRRVGTIFLTPSHAKSLVGILSAQVAMYESRHGALSAIDGDGGSS